MEVDDRNATTRSQKLGSGFKLEKSAHSHRKTSSEMASLGLGLKPQVTLRSRKSLASLDIERPEEEVLHGLGDQTPLLPNSKPNGAANAPGFQPTRQTVASQSTQVVNCLLERLRSHQLKNASLRIQAVLLEQKSEISRLTLSSDRVAPTASDHKLLKPIFVSQPNKIGVHTNNTANNSSPEGSSSLTDCSLTSENNSRIRMMVVRNKQSQVLQLEKQVAELDLIKEKRILISQLADQKRKIEQLKSNLHQNSMTAHFDANAERKRNLQLKQLLDKLVKRGSGQQNWPQFDISECNQSMKPETNASTMLPATGTVEIGSLDALQSPINKITAPDKHSFSVFAQKFADSDPQNIRKRLCSQTQTDLISQKTKSSTKSGKMSIHPSTSEAPGLTSMESTPSNSKKDAKQIKAELGLTLRPVLGFELEGISNTGNNTAHNTITFGSSALAAQGLVHGRMSQVLKEPTTHRSKKQTLEKIQESTFEDKASSSVSPGNATARLLSPEMAHPKDPKSNRAKPFFELTRVIEIKKTTQAETSSPDSTIAQPSSSSATRQQVSGSRAPPPTKDLIVKVPSHHRVCGSREDRRDAPLVVRRLERKFKSDERQAFVEGIPQGYTSLGVSVELRDQGGASGVPGRAKQGVNPPAEQNNLLKQVAQRCLKLNLEAQSDDHSSSRSSTDNNVPHHDLDDSSNMRPVDGYWSDED